MPRTCFVPLALSLLPSLLSAQAAPPPAHHLVEVVTSGPQQMQRLLAMDLDLAACQPPLRSQRRVEVIATDAELAALQQAGFRCTVRQRDLEAFYAAAAAASGVPATDTLLPPLGQGAMGGHYTLAQMEALLDQFHQQYPAICSAKVSIGTSIQGRSIWMVKISDHVGTDENEPEVLYDALHHAREPLSMETTLLFMDRLLDGYGHDPEATFLVDERELYFVPCVNPDGYEYNRTTNPGGGGLWRKNRRANLGGSYGVDLNRNYATGWNAPNGGSSTVATSETYRGTAPFSEPETAALEAFAAGRSFTSVFTTHTYQDILLRPWAYQNGEAANAADYVAMSTWMVLENLLSHGPCSTALYIAAGTSIDHHHVARGSYCMSAELGRSNEGGFWPSGTTINSIANRHQPMFRKFALAAGAAFEITAATVTEAPGGNGNGRVEPGEGGEVTVGLANRGCVAATATVQLLAGNGLALGAPRQLPLPRFGAAGTGSQPLTFTVPAGYALPAAPLRLQVTGDGRTQTRSFTLAFTAARQLLDDDAERDRGWQAGSGDTATTGRFERAVPQATLDGAVTAQPGTQTTPGGSRCFVTGALAGASATANDVDGGYTDLRSPVLDLAHLFGAEASFDLWWYESAGNDAVRISVSRDGGGMWEELAVRTASTGAYTRITVDLGAPLTAQMQLRVRAEDHVDSVVEAAVDGFALRGYAVDGSLQLLGSGAIGSVLRAGMTAPPGGVAFLLASLLPSSPLTFPGITGALRLDPGQMIAFPGQLADAGGQAALDVDIPPQPSLAGLPLWFQQAFATPSVLGLGPDALTVVLH